MSAIQHAKFIDRLRGSKRGQWAFAYWLNSQGYWTMIPPIKEAPTAAEHKKYRDKGDVFAWEEGGPRLRVEVKTLGIVFTGPRDWPYREVFVASEASVRRAIGDVFAWVSVSDDLAAAAIVEETTSDELATVWGEEIRWCIEQFGADRCMFESNFPVDRMSCSYAVLWNGFKRMTADRSDAERAALFHDTATRVYRL